MVRDRDIFVNDIKVGDWVYLTKRIEEYQKNPIDMCKDAPSQPFKTKVRNIVRHYIKLTDVILVTKILESVSLKIMMMPEII